MFEHLIAPYADRLITVNDSLAAEFKSGNRIGKRPAVLYNVSPLAIPKAKDRKLLRGKVKADEADKLILFIGALSKNRGIENLVKALDYLDPEFKLAFLGYGSLANLLKDLSKQKGYRRRVFVLDPVSPRDVVKWASGADVGVAPIQNASWSYFHSSPNKIFEYLMAGLPIACSDFPEMRKIILGNRVGTVFDPEDPKDTARAIKRVFSSESNYRNMKENSIRAAKEKFNWEIEEQKLIRVYKSLIQ